MMARARVAGDAATTQALEHAFALLPGIRPVGELASMTSPLTGAERVAIVDQALLLIEGLYAHLPMKRLRHAIDPAQALRVLRAAAPDLADLPFHSQLLGIFKSLRDIHTAYTAPPPYAGLTAFLPFLIEPCRDARGHTRYLVTRVLKGFDHPTFRPGVEILHWHGAPVGRAVERNAAREEGANPASRQALGHLFMTVRWLGACLVPDEDWVILGYRHGRGQAEIRLPWSLLALDDPGVVFAIQTVWLFEAETQERPAGEPLGLNRALNVRTQVEQVTRRHLFAGDAGPATPAPAAAPAPTSLLPHLMTAELLPDPAGGAPYGYLRLRAFEHHDVRGFVAEFRRLVEALPRHGLVIDVRGNPGGVVECAEGILQLLTPRTITPLPFQFLATELVDQLRRAAPDLSFGALLERKRIARAWGPSIALARETGALFSGGAPLTAPADANDVGQVYFGPVVLIVDAITYSAGDIFAAGFQDHLIGPVLGTDAQTGAGGANVWPHEHLVELLPDVPALQPLPQGAKLRVAVRRCTRTGRSAGLPIEELGVRADATHALTEADLLDDNRDLKAAAIAQIAGRPAIWLDAELTTAPQRCVVVTPTGLDRLDVHVDDRPLVSVDLAGDAQERFALPDGWPAARVVVEGFAGGALVARRLLVAGGTG